MYFLSSENMLERDVLLNNNMKLSPIITWHFGGFLLPEMCDAFGSEENGSSTQNKLSSVKWKAMCSGHGQENKQGKVNLNQGTSVKWWSQGLRGIAPWNSGIVLFSPLEPMEPRWSHFISSLHYYKNWIVECTFRLTGSHYLQPGKLPNSGFFSFFSLEMFECT